MANVKEWIQSYFAQRAEKRLEQEKRRELKQQESALAQTTKAQSALVNLAQGAQQHFQQKGERIGREARDAGQDIKRFAGLMGGLAVTSGVASTRGIFIILSMLMFFLIDIRLAFNGLDFARFIGSLPSILQIIGWSSLGLIIVAVGFICIFLRVDKRELSSWIAVVLAFYLVFISVGYDTASFIHIVFALAVLIAYLYPSLGDRAKANFAIVVMLFFDFFLFSFLAWFGGVTNISALISAREILYIPWWTIAILLYPFNLKRSLFVKIVSAIFLIFYVIVYLAPSFSYLDLSAKTDFEPKEVLKEQWDKFLDNGANLVRSVITKGEEGTESMIRRATGPYYSGVVDENEEKPLGVYIEDIKTAYPYFYYDDEIVLSAEVNVNALSEPVYVAMNCSIEDKNGTVSPDYYPENDWNFDIAESESILTDCTFEPGLFEEGVYRATFTADFNFVTYSYLQRYFVDETTARSTAIDILLKGYDKNPVSHSTGGPVKITMTPSGESPIILVKQTVDTRYRFGFDVQNNWRAQDGKIKDLNDIIILIPDSMNIRSDLDGYDCSHTVIDASVGDCMSGCENSELCEDICETAFDGHRGYKINPEVLQQEDRLKDIEDVRTFNCEIEIPVGNRERVLGETVPNVLEFRVIAKYDYRSEEESSSFRIKLRPGFNIFIEPVKATSADFLRCVGSHSEKNINRATYQFFRVEGDNEIPIPDESGNTNPLEADCNSKKRTCMGDFFPKQPRDTIVRCRMTAYIEGEEPESDSRTIKIKNAPPEVRVYFEPDQVNESSSSLACNGNVRDEDRDGITVSYTVEAIDPEPEDPSEDKPEEYKISTKGVSCQPDDDGDDKTCSVAVIIPSEQIIAKRQFKCKMTPGDDSGADNNWGKPDYDYIYVKPIIKKDSQTEEEEPIQEGSE